MKSLILAVLLLSGAQTFAQEASVPVCDRHPKVREAIEQKRKRPCTEIDSRGLSFVFEVRIETSDPSELKASDFEGLSEVSRLTIIGQGDRKSEIDTKIFSQLPKLEALILRNIDLGDVPNDFLVFNEELRRLALENCNLTDVPKVRGTLEIIDLSQNQIAELPEDFHLQYYDTSTLDLEENKLTNIDSLTKFGRRIGRLSLAGNPIPPMECEAQTQFLKRLKGLTINTSSINMGCSFKNLVVIDSLVLNGGSVKDFSFSFLSELKRAKRASFSNFVIDDDFMMLFKGSRIAFLTLIDTDLTNLRLDRIQTIGHLTQIEIFDLHRTSLHNVFNGATGITFVNIKMPNLNYIPDDMFQGLPDLILVGFKNTPLANTSKAAFRGVPRVLGLPINFGVTETGGSSQEWAP